MLSIHMESQVLSALKIKTTYLSTYTGREVPKFRHSCLKKLVLFFPNYTVLMRLFLFKVCTFQTISPLERAKV